MNKQQFLSTLEKKLKPLPLEEKQSALEFYNDFFNDAESEEIALQKLGSPKLVAATLLVEFTQTKQKTPSITILLAILSAPLAIPLSVGAFLIMLAFILLVFSIIFTLLAFNLALVLTALFSLVSVIPAFMHNIPTGLIYMGTAMVLATFSYIFFFVCKGVSSLVVKLIKTILTKANKRRVANEN